MARTPRERLTEAAFELFDEHGFEQTTVDDVAERAGVGRTTFFRSFRSKEDVVLPDHAQALTAVRERLAAATPQTAHLAVAEAARLVLRRYLAEGAHARSRYRLTSTVPALRAREIAGQQQYQRTFREFIHASTGGTPATALRAELMANAVITAHNHVLRAWLRGDSETPETDFDAAMAEVLGLFEPADRPAADEASVVVRRTIRDLEELLPQLRLLVHEG